MKVKDLVLMAVYVALFVVLDYMSNLIPILKMSNGGSVSLSVIPLILSSYHLGYKKGLFTCVIAVFLMRFLGPMYTPNLLGFLLDYLLAFCVYGIACKFPNISKFYTGILITGFIRFMLHTISGVIVWSVPLIGSIAYNLPYMSVTTIITLFTIPFILQTIKKI